MLKRANARLRGYRTIIYNLVSGIVGSGLVAVLLTTDWQVLGFSAKSAGWIMLGLKVFDHTVNIALRAATKTPVGKGE